MKVGYGIKHNAYSGILQPEKLLSQMDIFPGSWWLSVDPVFLPYPYSEGKGQNYPPFHKVQASTPIISVKYSWGKKS